MRYPTLSAIIALALVNCSADQASTPSTQAAPGTAVLCDGTIFNLTRTLTDAELQAFAGTWAGSAVGMAGRYKGCTDGAVTRQHTLTDSSLRIRYKGSGHSCGQGNYEDTDVLPFANRLRGDGFYRRRADGRQFALFLDDEDQLRLVSDTAKSRTCWVQTLRRVE